MGEQEISSLPWPGHTHLPDCRAKLEGRKTGLQENRQDWRQQASSDVDKVRIISVKVLRMLRCKQSGKN
jgi:hypothetical protein